jgi:DNA phosphorothioation-dependent restriction protein DptG
MTKLLEQAFEEAKQLPEAKQDELAERLLIALDEERWDELFACPESHRLLEQLADEALEDLSAGRTTELDPDKL